MQHKTIRGKILYLHDGQETGREWFTITKHGDGSRGFYLLARPSEHSGHISGATTQIARHS